MGGGNGHQQSDIPMLVSYTFYVVVNFTLCIPTPQQNSTQNSNNTEEQASVCPQTQIEACIFTLVVFALDD